MDAFRAWRLRRRMGVKDYTHEPGPSMNSPEFAELAGAIERLYARHADHRLDGFLVLSAWTGPGIEARRAEIECFLSPMFKANPIPVADLMRAMAAEISGSAAG